MTTDFLTICKGENMKMLDEIEVQQVSGGDSQSDLAEWVRIFFEEARRNFERTPTSEFPF
jgi:hypothetical protein